LQIKTPTEIVAELQKILEELQALHKKECEDLDAQGRRNALDAKGNTEQLKMLEHFNLRQARVKHRATRLTMQNILRLFLVAGIRSYKSKIPQLLADINDHGITRGRPREG
jgi:hypothetical protein